jgi:hypothetical protein
MKRRSLYILTIFFAFVLGFVACEKDDQIKLDAHMESWNTSGITSTSAELSGFVIAQGDGFTEQGVCWSTQTNPTIDINKKEAENIEGAVYWVNVDGLEHLTKYYYKAYVIQTSGEVTYGEEKSFTTLANIATVTMVAPANITDRTVDMAGDVPYDGKSEVTAKGFCWALTQNPTIANDTTIDGNGTGQFTRVLKKLMPATTYYIRAYATNKIGVAYSSEATFTTLAGVPVVNTSEVANVTKTSATLSGNVEHDGGSTLTERGFVYGLTENPTVADTKVIDDNNVVGIMNADLAELEPGVTYHVRAYAINASGTAYGENVEFTTVPNIITWFLPGSYVADSYPVGDYANWSPESSPYVQNTIAVGDQLEGYAYMANASNEWKFATDNTWSTNYGDDGADGNLEAGGANIVSEAGYYKINVDMSGSPYTYTAVKTDWGVVGDATPGGWGTDTDLTYDPATQTWRGTVHLTAGAFKFRANDGWDINYGSSTADENLNPGGDNISTDTEADYEFILDLSTPNSYTYQANRWGVIGDATPGSWGADTDMTWDATNKVFTVTLNLVVGEFKFRANDDWGLNYGGALDNLEQGGSNIPIATAGNYTITFNPLLKVATVTQN